MQVTDTAVIQNAQDNFSCMNDGTFVVLQQGKYIVDLCTYESFDDDNSVLYELTIIQRKEEEDSWTFVNFSELEGASIEHYDSENAQKEYYATREEAMQRFSALIVELTHF